KQMVIVEMLGRWYSTLSRYLPFAVGREIGNVLGLFGALFILAVILRFGRKAAKAICTLRGLALTPGLSRILARWVRTRSYSEEEFLRADGAGEQWVKVRRQALDALAALLRTQTSKSIAWGNRLNESFSDLRFTDANRVPFPFRRVM